MLHFHVLSFLNKRKVWGGRLALLEQDAARLIPDLAARMIEAAAESGYRLDRLVARVTA